ncbi:hypothetical protein N9928_01200 [bacterium]|nr:hypothetical protein [bacterium]
MKTISLFTVKVLAVIGANLAFAWMCIEFILYLVKDRIFNWWSVWSFMICVVVAIAIVALVGFEAIKNRKEHLKAFEQRRENKPKSKFRQRLDEAMKEANTNR